MFYFLTSDLKIICYGNPDNNFESLCITTEEDHLYANKMGAVNRPRWNTVGTARDRVFPARR
jgi:hypothetical protein